MVEIACKSCRAKVQVESLLAAAQQPCPECGKLLMGELATQRFSQPPAAFQETAAAAEKAEEPAPFDFRPALIAAVALGLIPPVVAHFDDVLPPEIFGAVMGAFIGAACSPLLMLAMLMSGSGAVVSPYQLYLWGDDVDRSLLSGGLAKATNEGRIDKIAVYFLIFVVINLVVGGWIGSHFEDYSTPAIVIATVGAGVLGGSLGFLWSLLNEKKRT